MKRFALTLLCFVAAMACGCEGSAFRLGKEGMAKKFEEARLRSDAATIKIYSNTSPEKVIAAAHKILVLWDNPRLTFTNAANGFTAERKAPWFAPTIYQQGRTEWAFRAVPDGNGGVKASVNTATYVAMGNPGVTYTGVPRSDGLAAYALFWRRMDYLLGFNKTWTTCTAFEEERKNIPDLADGSLRPLCASFIEDTQPN